jgi:hypothetical protein
MENGYTITNPDTGQKILFPTKEAALGYIQEVEKTRPVVSPQVTPPPDSSAPQKLLSLYGGYTGGQLQARDIAGNTLEDLAQVTPENGVNPSDLSQIQQQTYNQAASNNPNLNFAGGVVRAANPFSPEGTAGRLLAEGIGAGLQKFGDTSVGAALGNTRVGKFINDTFGVTSSKASLLNKSKALTNETLKDRSILLGSQNEVPVNLPAGPNPMEPSDLSGLADKFISNKDKATGSFLNSLAQKAEQNIPLTPGEATNLGTILGDLARNPNGVVRPGITPQVMNQWQNGLRTNIQTALGDAAPEFNSVQSTLSNNMSVAKPLNKMIGKVYKLRPYIEAGTLANSLFSGHGKQAVADGLERLLTSIPGGTLLGALGRDPSGLLQALATMGMNYVLQPNIPDTNGQ